MDLENRLNQFKSRVDLTAVSTGLLIVSSVLVYSQTVSDPVAGEGVFQVTVNVEKPSQNLSRNVGVRNGSTAFSALNSSFEVEYEESSYGYFITSIDGLSQNGSHYWLYRVNGKTPEVGAGQYVLEREDNVSFRYLSQSEYE